MMRIAFIRHSVFWWLGKERQLGEREDHVDDDGHGNLQNHQDGHRKEKQVLLRLVVEEYHAAECSERSVEEGREQQDELGYTPVFVYSLVLVVAEETERDDIGEEYQSQVYEREIIGNSHKLYCS